MIVIEKIKNFFFQLDADVYPILNFYLNKSGIEIKIFILLNIIIRILASSILYLLSLSIICIYKFIKKKKNLIDNNLLLQNIFRIK